MLIRMAAKSQFLGSRLEDGDTAFALLGREESGAHQRSCGM